MLTWRYSKEYPDGKLFDTEGREHPTPPSELNGWFDCRSKIHTTQDDLIAAVVKREMATQTTERDELEREYEKKTGDKAHYAAKDKTLEKVLDMPGIKPKKRKK